jgi:hypothetical protein
LRDVPGGTDVVKEAGVAGPLDTLSDSDRRDFEQRLGTLGLNADALLAPELISAQSTVTTLTMTPSVPSQFRPVVLRTSDFNQLNRWVGVPDRVFDNVPPIVELPPQRLSAVARELRPSRRIDRVRDVARAPGTVPEQPLSSEDLASVRVAARAFLRGDSRRVAHFKDLIERVFPVVEISVWPFLNVVVKSGSVLEFGPGQNTLVAHTLTIEEGGRIRSYGNLDVSATILRRDVPPVVHPIDPSLTIGRRFGRAFFEG